MVAGMVKPCLFDVLMMHNMVAEKTGKAFCPNDQHQLEKIYRECRIFCDEPDIMERNYLHSTAPRPNLEYNRKK